MDVLKRPILIPDVIFRLIKKIEPELGSPEILQMKELVALLKICENLREPLVGSAFPGLFQVKSSSSLLAEMRKFQALNTLAARTLSRILELCNEVYVRAELLGVRDIDAYRQRVLQVFARAVFGWRNAGQVDAGARFLEILCTASVDVKRAVFWV